MLKYLFAVIACLAVVGCKEQGASFIGEWKSNEQISETIVVTKVDGGYRAISKLGNADMSFMDLDLKLVAESDTTLISAVGQSKALELASDGSLTSYLRNKPKVMEKTN